MSENHLFEEITEQQGWNESSQVAVLLRYIENQDSYEAFRDFLLEQACAENEQSLDLDSET